MAARLEYEGFDVQLRGALDSPYGLTVGEMARVDLYVPGQLLRDASQFILNIVNHFDGVGARLPAHLERDGWHAVEPGD